MERKQITINEFLKKIKKTFGDFEYKATSKDGQVFKSTGYNKAIEKVKK